MAFSKTHILTGVYLCACVQLFFCLFIHIYPLPYIHFFFFPSFFFSLLHLSFTITRWIILRKPTDNQLIISLFISTIKVSLKLINKCYVPSPCRVQSAAQSFVGEPCDQVRNKKVLSSSGYGSHTRSCLEHNPAFCVCIVLLVVFNQLL